MKIFFRCTAVIFTNRLFGFLFIILISLLSVLAAFMSEIFLGLEPCILCIYQRWPFAITAALGICGLLLRKKPKVSAILFSISALTYLVNAAIAFYHSGVEKKWWVSEVEGCAVPMPSDETQNWIENIMSAPSKSCDEIAWADPLLGLTMANLNIILCLSMFLFCIAATVLSLRKS